MNIVLVRRIIAIAQESTAIYIEGEGALCPVCVALQCPARGRTTSTRGDGIRYHTCSQCGNHFKSIERIEPRAEEAPSVKSTQTADKPPKKRQSKNRKG